MENFKHFGQGRRRNSYCILIFFNFVIQAILLVFLWMVCYNLISMDESSENYFDYCLMVFQSGFFSLGQSPRSGTEQDIPSSIKCFVIVLLTLWHSNVCEFSITWAFPNITCRMQTNKFTSSNHRYLTITQNRPSLLCHKFRLTFNS